MPILWAAKGALFRTNQGTKWGFIAGCCSEGPAVRTSYDLSGNAPWHEAAIKAWNERKPDWPRLVREYQEAEKEISAGGTMSARKVITTKKALFTALEANDDHN